MALTISSSFDAGNIRVINQSGDSADLEIVTDHMSDFYQWFYFRVAGGAGRELTLRITNCAGSAYPHGWPDYKAVMSLDREEWLRVSDTSYLGRRPDHQADPAAGRRVDRLFRALFDGAAPRPRHPDRRARRRRLSLARQEPRRPGHRLPDDRFAARSTSGSTPASTRARSMAEWWMEGALEKLTDEDDPVARVLRRDCTFRIVPNMNPDGSRRGHLRTNAAGVNLNREWHAPSAEKSPEVLCVRNAMDETGIDFAMDVHGDEAIPANFLAGFEGIPSLKDGQLRLFNLFSETLERDLARLPAQPGL